MSIRQASSDQESRPCNPGQGEKESPRGGVRARKRSPRRSRGRRKEEARREEVLRKKQNLNQGVRKYDMFYVLLLLHVDYCIICLELRRGEEAQDN